MPLPIPRPTPPGGGGGPRQPLPIPRPTPTPRKPGMPSYKKGGVVKKTGPALVHKGERVIPVKKTKKK